MSEEYVKILDKLDKLNDKLNDVDTNVKLAKNDTEHVKIKLCTHLDSYEKHKEDYYTWRNKADIKLDRNIEKCPVEDEVVTLDKEKISKKSFYSTCGIIVFVLGIAEGIRQWFK